MECCAGQRSRRTQENTPKLNVTRGLMMSLSLFLCVALHLFFVSFSFQQFLFLRNPFAPLVHLHIRPVDHKRKKSTFFIFLLLLLLLLCFCFLFFFFLWSGGWRASSLGRTTRRHRQAHLLDIETHIEKEKNSEIEGKKRDRIDG